MHSTLSVWLGLRIGPPVFDTNVPRPGSIPKPACSLWVLRLLSNHSSSSASCFLLWPSQTSSLDALRQLWEGLLGEMMIRSPKDERKQCWGTCEDKGLRVNEIENTSRIKTTWKLNGTRRWQCAPYPEQVKWESWTLTPTHSCHMSLLVNLCLLLGFFPPSYPIPKLCFFLVPLFSLPFFF